MIKKPVEVEDVLLYEGEYVGQFAHLAGLAFEPHPILPTYSFIANNGSEVRYELKKSTIVKTGKLVWVLNRIIPNDYKVDLYPLNHKP